VRLGISYLQACGACGSWTYFPRTTAEQQSKIHDNESYFDHPYFELRRNQSRAQRRRCRTIFARLAPSINLQSLRGQRLLDVGCDTGSLLVAAREEYGIRPVGIDVAGRAVAVARENGVEALQTTLEAAPEDLTAFQVITAVDLVEHVPDPDAFLREVRRRLQPGGVTYLETPNIRSLVYVVGRVLARLTQGRPQSLFERIFPPQHVQYFTIDSLGQMAERTGYEVIEISTRPLPWHDIAASKAVRTGMAFLQFFDRFLGREILICAVLRRPLD
jgi:cyclopropane fatty-acyl-phospholipid synthase-like methyltransferase